MRSILFSFSRISLSSSNRKFKSSAYGRARTKAKERKRREENGKNKKENTQCLSVIVLNDNIKTFYIGLLAGCFEGNFIAYFPLCRNMRVSVVYSL